MQNLEKLGLFTGIIDASKYQTLFELDIMISGGIYTFIHQASQGDTADPYYIERFGQFITSAQNNKHLPLMWGAYCLLNPYSRFNGAKQAQVFFETIMKTPMDHLLPVLDLEGVEGKNTKITKWPTFEMVEDFIVCLLENIQKHSKAITLPLLYGNAPDLNHIFGTDPNKMLAGYRLSQYKIWLAAYPPADPSWSSALDTLQSVTIPSAWKKKDVVLWQYTNGKQGPEPRVVPGCSNDVGYCDRNAFVGSTTAWQTPIEGLQSYWDENSYPTSRALQVLPTPQTTLNPQLSSTMPFFAPAASSSCLLDAYNCIQTFSTHNDFDVAALSSSNKQLVLHRATEGKTLKSTPLWIENPLKSGTPEGKGPSSIPEAWNGQYLIWEWKDDPFYSQFNPNLNQSAAEMIKAIQSLAYTGHIEAAEAKERLTLR